MATSPARSRITGATWKRVLIADERHYLVIGPWDHAGTRTPTEEVGGVKFGHASLLDLNNLHKEWYDWTMKDGPRPRFLEKRVAYYVPGDEAWKYADSLEGIGSKPETLYLTTPDGSGNDVFHSGSLARTTSAGSNPAAICLRPNRHSLWRTRTRGDQERVNGPG